MGGEEGEEGEERSKAAWVGGGKGESQTRQ